MLNKVRYTNTKGNRHITACCLFLFLIGPLLSHAQTPARGKLEVIKDARIDTLMARRLETPKSGAGAGGGYISTQGYRIQFYSGGSRAEAYKAQERFNQRFPELRTYITYREPNFKVKGGDFRSRLEASKYLQQIRPVFPVLFIIYDKITPPAQ